MGINISISNVNVQKDLRILNEAKVEDENDINLQVNESDVMGSLDLLNGIEVRSLKNDLSHKIAMMDKDSKEYQQILQLLSNENSSDNVFIQNLKSFMREFSQGFLAEFLGGWLMSHI